MSFAVMYCTTWICTVCLQTKHWLKSHTNSPISPSKSLQW